MAGRILEEDVNTVRERADLAEIAAEYMQLKRAGGGRFKALCPFHAEKTPSFTIDPAKGLYYCFGCSKGGNVYSLLMELENLTFAETVERLAARTGITLRYENLSPAEREASGKRMRMIAAHRAAVAFYHDVLLSKDGESAREYLKGRKFSKQTAVEFTIGFSPKSSRDALVQHLTKEGFQVPLLVEAGLARKGSEGITDAFRGRVMFPIFDIAGDPVAFGARILDGNGPKYLNTAETPIWHKGRALYAMHLAKASIVKENAAILVEGYTDVIALHQAGVRTAVASCGTALGLEHFKLLRRFTDRAILAYDADQAGQAAAARAFEEAFGFSQETGIDTRVIELPAGSDPADFVAAKGAEGFTALAETATPVVEYRLRREIDAGRFDLSSGEGRDRALKVTLPILRQVKDEVLRRHYARRLAGRLKVDEDLVVLGADPGLPQANATRDALKRVSAQVRLEREVLKLALQYPDLVEPFVDRVGEEEFSVKAHRSIWMELRKGTDPAALPNTLEDANAKKVVAGLAIEEIPGEVGERFAEDVFARLKGFALSRQIDQIKTKLQALNPLKFPVEYKTLLEEFLALEGKRREMTEEGS